MASPITTTLLRTQSDERLVALTATGHARAFEAIVDRYRKPLLRYAGRFLPDSRAEDVVQAAFVSAWTALAAGTEVRDVRPWLYRIVHNGALNAMKRAGNDDAPLAEAVALGSGPEAEILQREDVRAALGVISELPERQRAALLAVALEGRSHAEVGAELGLNDTAVRQLVRRARVSLRAAATAITPMPVAAWLAGSAQEETVGHIGELVAGTTAGGLLGGAAAMKAGAVVATVGALAIGTPKVAEVVRDGGTGRSAAAASQPGDSGGSGGGGSSLGGTPPGGVPIAAGAGGEQDDPSSGSGTSGSRGSGDDEAGGGDRRGSWDDGSGRGRSRLEREREDSSGSGGEDRGSGREPAEERSGSRRRSSGDRGDRSGASGGEENETPQAGEDDGSRSADETSSDSGSGGGEDDAEGGSGGSGSSDESGSSGRSGSSGGSGSGERPGESSGSDSDEAIAEDSAATNVQP